jgi:thimet oligopeptidase
VGRRYRDIILANGAQRPPEELVREFLGRDFNAQAFDDFLKR